METKARECIGYEIAPRLGFGRRFIISEMDYTSAGMEIIGAADKIYFIEKSAYEQSQKRVEELESALQGARAHAEVMEHKATRVNSMLRDREAENKKLREALKLSENKITMLDSTIDFYELNQWRSAVEDVMGDDCFFQALGEAGE